MEQIQKISPIAGAAEYVVQQALMGHCIVMYPADGEGGSVIQSGIKKYETAMKAAARWQKKENAAVLKSNSK